MKSDTYDALLSARANTLIAITGLEKSNEVVAVVMLPNLRAALEFIEMAMSEQIDDGESAEDADGDWREFEDANGE